MNKDEKREFAISYLQEQLKDFDCTITVEDFQNLLVIKKDKNLITSIGSKNWKSKEKLTTIAQAVINELLTNYQK